LNLFQNKQYEAARYAFSRAFELDPQTDTLVELGLAELEAGHPFAAVEHLREYLDRKDAPAANADAVRTQWLPRAEDETALKEFFPEPVPLPASDGTHPAEPSAPVMSHSWIAPPVSYERGRTTRSPARWATAMGLESAALAAAGVAIGFSVAVERAASEANGLIQRVRSETGGDSGCLAPNPASACPPGPSGPRRGTRERDPGELALRGSRHSGGARSRELFPMALAPGRPGRQRPCGSGPGRSIRGGRGGGDLVERRFFFERRAEGTHPSAQGRRKEWEDGQHIK
jgi:hypothetical protein